jgi:2-aminoethylphosphonate-pyruvate transaminase
MAAPRTAVVLAAGMGSRLAAEWHSQPKGFLRLGERPIIKKSLERLRRAEIDRVLIVTGHCKEFYDELARYSGGFVETVHNARFQQSGSLYSLYQLKEVIDDDFLLLESDLIYEQRALTSAIEFPRDNCVLLSGFTDSGDEVFVELADGRLVHMSKDRSVLGEIAGELVGIAKISANLFAQICAIAEVLFKDSLDKDYETDGLVSAARCYPVYGHLVEDLLWAEIDDARHLERARQRIYPHISRVDR